MQTIAVAMGKGGTGKTSVAVHLAAGLASKGRRVLLVDMDPTGHATAWLLGLDANGGPGLADALRSDSLGAEHLRNVEGRPGLALLPATRALAGAELALAGEEGGQAILRGLLADNAARWDFAILDCPPSLGILTINALAAADAVLAPVPCTFLGLAGLRLLGESVARINKRLGGRARILGYLLFGADPREAITAQTRELLHREAPELLYRSEVRVSAAAKALPAQRRTAWDAGADARGAEDYDEVVRETLRRLGKGQDK